MGSALIALVVGLSACGAEKPVAQEQGFHRADRDHRVFASYQNAHDSFTRHVRLPSGTRHVQVRMDCIGKGFIRVDVFGGTVSVPCGATSDPDADIGLTKDHPLLRASRWSVRVRAPKDSTWSVAVDAGPGTINLALDQ